MASLFVPLPAIAGEWEIHIDATPGSHEETENNPIDVEEQLMSTGLVLESCIGPRPDPTVVATDLPCQVTDADLWFAEDPRDLERAKELCTDCPLRSACLAEALDRSEPWGVWGGEIFDRGTVVARKRPRGRPRKSAA